MPPDNPSGTEDYVQLATDVNNTGKKMRSRVFPSITDPTANSGAGTTNQVEAEVFVIGDPSIPTNLASVTSHGDLSVDDERRRSHEVNMELAKFGRKQRHPYDRRALWLDGEWRRRR